MFIRQVYYNIRMKLMAIDYGLKRVGLASTDESGQFALPRLVLPNDDGLMDSIVRFANENKIEKVIIGESRNLSGEPNAILEDIQKFREDLQNRGLETEMHTEVYTSMEADRIQGQTPMRDASAAAIILKSYIDRGNNK
jgi:putative Holliday junction resolvase